MQCNKKITNKNIIFVTFNIPLEQKDFNSVKQVYHVGISVHLFLLLNGCRTAVANAVRLFPHGGFHMAAGHINLYCLLSIKILSPKLVGLVCKDSTL